MTFAAASTATGPTECQASLTVAKSRVGWRSPRRYSGMAPSTIPAATSSGTVPSGTRKSIGTKHELGGDREAVADREAHPGHERVDDDERERERRVEGALGGDRYGERGGDGQECGGRRGLDRELPAAQRLGPTLVPGLV